MPVVRPLMWLRAVILDWSGPKSSCTSTLLPAAPTVPPHSSSSHTAMIGLCATSLMKVALEPGRSSRTNVFQVPSMSASSKPSPPPPVSAPSAIRLRSIICICPSPTFGSSRALMSPEPVALPSMATAKEPLG